MSDNNSPNSHTVRFKASTRDAVNLAICGEYVLADKLATALDEFAGSTVMDLTPAEVENIYLSTVSWQSILRQAQG